MALPVPDRLPVLRLPTLGGKQLWTDLVLYAGHRIQRNTITEHCRLLDPRDRLLAAGSFGHCHEALERRKASESLAPRSSHAVLLLHGIFRSKDALGPMTRALRAEGYEAEALNYASTRRTIDTHAANVEHILDTLEDIDTVSFVCHSMGGLVARTVLARAGAWKQRIKVNRLVMIATPNKGASIASFLGQFGPFHWVAGPAGRELTPEGVEEIPLPTCPFGIVAGVRGDARGFNPLLSGDDDFTVTLEETHLDGAEDVLVVPGVHTFVMVKPEVIRATVHYLETGTFQTADP